MIRSKSQANSQRSKQALKEEQRIASILGGKTLVRSGAVRSRVDGRTACGDIDAGIFWIEQKSTSKDDLVVQRWWLEKVSIGASDQSKWPALSITFQVHKQDWVGTPSAIFRQFAPGYRSNWACETTARGSISLHGPALKEYRAVLPKADAQMQPSFELCFVDKEGQALQRWQFVPLMEFKKLVESRR